MFAISLEMAVFHESLTSLNWSRLKFNNKPRLSMITSTAVSHSLDIYFSQGSLLFPLEALFSSIRTFMSVYQRRTTDIICVKAKKCRLTTPVSALCIGLCLMYNSFYEVSQQN